MNFRDKVFKLPGARLIFAALSCFFMGTTFTWLCLDRSPPHWDDSWYLTNSLVMFDALVEGGLGGYAKKFLTILGFKAPLITVLPTPVYLILGRNPRAAYGVNLVFMLLLFTTILLIAKKYWSSRVGLIAVTVVGTMPLLYGLSRWFLADYALVSLVCLAIYFLIESQNFEKTWKLFFFGITCGLGLLLKVTFPLYVVFPFLYVSIQALLRSKVQPASKASWAVSPLKTLSALILPAVLLPLPWYLFNYRRAIERALVSGFTEEADFYGSGDVFSLRTIKTYLVHLVNVGPSCYYVFLAVFLIGFIGMTGKIRPFYKRFSGEARVIFCLWVLPFLIFLFGRNKDVRFVAPLLPAFGLMLALTLDFSLNRLGRSKPALLCLLLAFPLVSLLQTSFGIFGNWRQRLGDFLFVAPTLAYARTYDRRVWPHQQILNTIYNSTRFKGGEKKWLILGTDRAAFNVNNFELAAVQGRLPFNLTSSAYEKDLNSLLPWVNSVSFFMYKEGGEPESSFYNKHLNTVLQEVRENGKFVEISYHPTLPDGGMVHIFENLSPHPFIRERTFLRAGLDQLNHCDVDFDNKIQLTGLSFEQTAGSLEVKYRWRCLKPLDREYRCFTHILDEQSNIVGSLDHDILGGDPPMKSWKEGDVAMENLRFKFSTSQAVKKLRLRLGLFHLPSGERLPITRSSLSGRASFPLTDHNTALLIDLISESR